MTWMYDEILECPAVVRRSLAEAVPCALAEGARWADSGVTHVEVLGRGSSSHAGTTLRYALAQSAGLSVSAALPLRSAPGNTPYRPVPRSVLVAISQSGGSPDLVAHARACAAAGMRVVGLINVPGSLLGRACTLDLGLQAGPERSVAATKSTVAALCAGLALVAGWRGRLGDERPAQALQALPALLDEALACDWSAWSRQLLTARAVYVIGRGATFGIAKEIALKIAETTGIPALAFSSAEFLHGPIGAVSSHTPVLGLSTDPATDDSVARALAEAAARGAATSAALSRSGLADALPMAAAADRGTGALALLPSAYLAIEAASRALGGNPDTPPGLRKVTETR